MTDIIFLHLTTEELSLPAILEDLKDDVSGITANQIWGMDVKMKTIDTLVGRGKTLSRGVHQLPDGVTVIYKDDEDNIGTGKYGSIFKTCKDEDCRLVAKFSEIDDNFFAEVRALNELRETGLVPLIHYAYVMVSKPRFRYNYTGVIIMERVEPIDNDEFFNMKPQFRQLWEKLEKK